MIRLAGNLREELKEAMDAVAKRAKTTARDCSSKEQVDGVTITLGAYWRFSKRGRNVIYREWSLEGKRIGINALFGKLKGLGLL